MRLALAFAPLLVAACASVLDFHANGGSSDAGTDNSSSSGSSSGSTSGSSGGASGSGGSSGTGSGSGSSGSTSGSGSGGADSGSDSEADAGCSAGLYEHTNGLGTGPAYAFCDSYPPGPPYPEALAKDACKSFTNNPTYCSTSSPCKLTPNETVVCNQDKTQVCVCWAYTGAAAGHVYDSHQTATSSCMCPTTTDPKWN
jgi:hypothetical protein